MAKNMTALEKIADFQKQLEKYTKEEFVQEAMFPFLLKAFHVMREVAIQVHSGEYIGVPGVIDQEFEERMSK